MVRIWGAKAVYKLVEGPSLPSMVKHLFILVRAVRAGVSAPIFHIGPDGLVLSEVVLET